MNSLDLFSKHNNNLSFNNEHKINYIPAIANNSANDLMESLDLIPHNYAEMEQLFSNQPFNKLVGHDYAMLITNQKSMNENYFSTKDFTKNFIESNKSNPHFSFLNSAQQSHKPTFNFYDEKWNIMNSNYDYNMQISKNNQLNFRGSQYNRWTNKTHPKPVFSYSCLIALALKNSQSGRLPVSEIYKYMQEKFPYFKTAPDGWKNSVRHNLSLNKAFCKVEKSETNSNQRKGCLWSLKPEKQKVVEKEIRKWIKKHPEAIKSSMSNPEEFHFSKDIGDESADELNGESSENSAQMNAKEISDKSSGSNQNFMNELLNDLSSQKNWPIFTKNESNDQGFSFSALIDDKEQFSLNTNELYGINCENGNYFDELVNE